MKLNKLLIINFLITLYLEIVFKVVVFKNLFSLNSFYLILFSFFVALFITIILRVLPEKVSKYLIHFIWFVVAFIFMIEIVYFKFYNTLVGVSAFEYTNQVMAFKSSILQVILDHLHILLLFLIPNIVLLSIKKYLDFAHYTKKETIITGLVFISLMLFFALSLFIKNNSNRDILLKKNNLLLTTDSFGLISGLNIDIFKMFINFKENSVVINYDADELNEEKEYNVTNIDFDTLKNSETDESIKSMHSYFDTIVPTEKNKYTGLFKGKNLIFIVAEAFYPIAINETLTPTLYKLQNEGFKFSNFYQPIYGCSTSDGEFTSLYSLLPGASTCTMKITQANYYPYNIGNVFGDEYNSYAFHAGTHKYYSRNKTFPNLGFSFYACGNGLNINCKSWPQSDVEMVQDSLRYYIKDDNFVTYYMSISGHLEYNFYGNLIARKNKSLVNELDASDAIKAYMATQIEFDRSIELLISELRKTGKLDDTVIAIVPDHYPYGLDNSEIVNYTGIKDITFEMYKNSFILWNSEMKKSITIDKYASNIDVLPTLLNLFGIEYDSRILIGKDILSNSEGIVMFNNFNWINEYGKYNYATKEFVSNNGYGLSEEEINKINTVIQNKFTMSKLIVLEDYYRKLFKEN